MQQQHRAVRGRIPDNRTGTQRGDDDGHHVFDYYAEVVEAMIPILFAATATNFQTNGIGRLADAISCVVSEERNGEYEMRMEYPITGAHYSDIGNSKTIVVKASQTAGLQAFRIYKISKPISGRVTVLCRHISYQLAYIPFKAFSATSLAGALAGFKSLAFGLPASIGVTFILYLIIGAAAEMRFYIPVYSIILSVVSIFVVVFLSMWYASARIRKDNLMDDLKEENF